MKEFTLNKQEGRNLYFGATAIQAFLINIAIFSVLYWILPRKYNWISYVVLTFLMSYMAYHLVPDTTDDLFRYYVAIDDLRENGWEKMKEFIEIDNFDMKNYFSVRYLFWLVSRTKSNHWLQAITIAFIYGSFSTITLLAKMKFNISKSYVYLGSVFFLSTYWYYDAASGVRNAFCFSIIVFCSYFVFVERKGFPLCIVGYIIAFYMHSSGLLAISLVIFTIVLFRIDSVFINFVFMFSLIGGNFLVQTLAEDSDSSLILSIAGRAERHVGGETIGQDTSFQVNIVTVALAILIVLFVSYYIKDINRSRDTARYYKYSSLTMYFVAGSIFSGMIFMRFARWIVPEVVALALMIGLQKQNDIISEKGEIFYKYYAIPLERFLYRIKPILIIVIIAYTTVHLWYDCNGSSLTWAHFRYEWEAMGNYDYIW